MTKTLRNYLWIPMTVIGSAVFALGFDLFLVPNDMNTGGISGLAMILVELLGAGSVGLLTILINLPLFFVAGKKIGKKFFLGSALGLAVNSLCIDLFALIPAPHTEPLIGAIYGGLICGLGLGMVFICGTSTGGSDIVVRLLKLRMRHVPIGTISIGFDLVVAVLTGIVFHDLTKTLYTGITVFVCGRIVDAVVYGFDYSKVAMIITSEYEQVVKSIDIKLQRGSTYLYGEGTYSGKPTKVILTAVKRRQVTELKELVHEIDPNAFVIVQEAHQVLGDGFVRYSKDSL